jgi:putative hydrolase of the HAD superfamily
MIAFDADDTLWENETHYQKGRALFQEIMAKYLPTEAPEERIDAIEIANLKYYGYGAKGFILSLIEAAIELSQGEISGADIQKLLDLGKEMITHPVELFPHVSETLEALYPHFRLMLITKGELNHQLSKVQRSGLQGYFKLVEVVDDKTPQVYANIFSRAGYEPASVMMVGNALRSDILPVLELGGWAVYIPHNLTWSHEHAHLPEGCAGHCYELEHIGLLPDLVKQLNHYPDH